MKKKKSRFEELDKEGKFKPKQKEVYKISEKEQIMIKQGVLYTIGMKKGIFTKLKEKFIFNRFLTKSVMVRMELKNGMHMMNVMKESNDGFKFKGKQYLFDTDMKYPFAGMKGLYGYDFHEDLVLPVKRRIDVQAIKDTLDSSNISEVETFIMNPSTAARFIEAKIAEGIMRGQQIDEMMKFLKFGIVYCGIILTIHFMLWVHASGMLSNLTA